MTKQEFEEKQKDILYSIPEQLHGAFTRCAWDTGHAYGYREVLLHLSNLVEIFEPYIRKFINELNTSNN